MTVVRIAGRRADATLEPRDGRRQNERQQHCQTDRNQHRLRPVQHRDDQDAARKRDPVAQRLECVGHYGSAWEQSLCLRADSSGRAIRRRRGLCGCHRSTAGRCQIPVFTADPPGKHQPDHHQSGVDQCEAPRMQGKYCRADEDQPRRRARRPSGRRTSRSPASHCISALVCTAGTACCGWCC